MVTQNIKHNSVRSLDSVLVHDEYYDYMLYKGEIYGPTGLNDDCIAATIDFSNPETYELNGTVKSIKEWTGATNEGVELEHIGMTGIDNGLIHYDKDYISNKMFYKLFTQSKLTIESGDTAFYMNPVTGNTKKYCYEMEKVEDGDNTYMAFKGGFLQGFYKVEGNSYQVLPDYIDNDWHFEFVIRPRTDYEICENSLNSEYPENSGYFFYIGTRAENKFAELMNRTCEYTCRYVPEFLADKLDDLKYYQYDDKNIFDANDIDFFATAEHEAFHDKCGGESGHECLESGETYDESFISDIVDAYQSYLVEEDMDLSGVTLSAASGYIEIETDNKFIYFNHTCTGFTVNTWDEDFGKILLTGYTRGEYLTNAFLLFNRTCTGLTVDDVDEYLAATSKDYDIQKDVIGNAFGLKYNEDGSLSYVYTMKDCDAEEGWSTQTETTKPGLILSDVWNVVNVRFTILDNSYKTCIKQDESGNTIQVQVPNNVGNRKMKIMVYVNGNLVLVSKELNEFRFRALNDMAERQEGVPFNISLGGGTQGLGERIWLDYKQDVKCHYYLEKTYAGSFAGDMALFNMYECKQNLDAIRLNYNKYIGIFTGGTHFDYNSVYVGSSNKADLVVNDLNKHTEFDECGDLYEVRVNRNYDKLYVLVPRKNKKVEYSTLSIGDVELQCNKYYKVINEVEFLVFESKSSYSAGERLKIKAFKK